MRSEIVDKAIYYEGHVPKDWELIGMTENRTHRFRLFKAPDGKLYKVGQKLKKKREPHICIRNENGYTFARRDFKRRPYESW